MGSGPSKSDRKNAFTDFTVYMGSLIESTSWFLMFSPKSVPEKKRKIITLNVDVFMSMVANAALRLKKLDSAFEDNADIITMFDAILHILWTSISKRYPHISRENNQVRKPRFIEETEYTSTCQWFQQKIVNIVTIICQSFVILGSCNVDEINDMRAKGPQGILSILETEFDAVETQLMQIGSQKNNPEFERHFYGTILLDFIGILRSLKDKLLMFDIEQLQLSKSEKFSSSSSSSGSELHSQSKKKRERMVISTKVMPRRMSDQPIATPPLIVKQEYERNSKIHHRSASYEESRLSPIDESPRTKDHKSLNSSSGTKDNPRDHKRSRAMSVIGNSEERQQVGTGGKIRPQVSTHTSVQTASMTSSPSISTTSQALTTTNPNPDTNEAKQ